jgi:hypothetical protein
MRPSGARQIPQILEEHAGQSPLGTLNAPPVQTSLTCAIELRLGIQPVVNVLADHILR